MTVRTILVGVVVIFACAGSGALYLHGTGCDSEPTLRKVTDTLRARFHLDGVFVNNVSTVTGGWFSDRHECSAEVAAIRGNVDASDMAWREIRFQIDRQTITVTLGGNVALAKPPPSLWEWMLALL